jgi:hypothetical protein
MHPTRSTSILISLAVVAACVVPVVARQKPVTPQVKTPSAGTHGPTATTTPSKQDAAKKTVAAAPAKAAPAKAAPAKAAPATAKSDPAKTGTAKAIEVKSKAPNATTQPAKPTTATTTKATPAAAKTTTATAKPAASAGPKTADTKPAAAASPATATKKNAATPTPAWTPDNPVAEKLASKPTILAKARGVLPADTDLNNATAGFKNFGQFVAAVNVSRNLGIPFADLKANVTGVKLDGQPTGKASTSLGGAIRVLKGDADPMGEAQRATAEAEAEIGEGTAPSRTTPATAAKAPAATGTSTAASGTPKTRKKPVGQSADATR